MAAELGGRLSCSICLDLCRELATLRCGHKLCGNCIAAALDTQEGFRVYSCPGCREEYAECPVTAKKAKLCNIVENVRSEHPEKSEILCTYCVDFRVAAVKTCLYCETSMCDKHLTAHNKTVGHVLMEPTSSFRSKKCSIHKKLLEYYCSEDDVCLCASCCLVGKHREHKVELLEEASEKKKEKLRTVHEKLITERGAIEERIQNLKDYKKKAQGKADNRKERVTALFEDIRRQLEVQAQKVLSEIASQEEKVSMSVSNLIQQMKIQRDVLSENIGHIEEICNKSDPITVLQEAEIEEQDVEEPEVCDLDDCLISLTLHRSLMGLITNITSKNKFHVTSFLLDEKTAQNLLSLSADLKYVWVSDTEQARPKSPKRFTIFPQVLSIESFSNGRHYWEVEVGDIDSWTIGICYPSIGVNDFIGENEKSWGLGMEENDLKVWHNLKEESLNQESLVQKLGVYLDYEAGRLSYYQLCDPIRHLHTFTATFTEPLHAAFYLCYGWLELI